MNARKSISVVLAATIVFSLIFYANERVIQAVPAQEDYQVTFGKKSRSSFNLDEDQMVWQESIMFDNSVYLYDAATRTAAPVTSSSAASVPDIFGNVVVWQDSREGTADIYMLDLTSGVETNITETPDVSEMWPFTDGEYIVYKPTH